MEKVTIVFALSVFLALVLFSDISHAALCSGFGSITHAGSAVRVKPGEYNYVKLSLFNCKNQDLIIEIDVDNLPKGWWFDMEAPGKEQASVLYLPFSEPTTTPDASGSWFVLSDGITYVKTVPVMLKIGVPSDAWGGLYKLKVSAFASPTEQDEGGFSIVPKFGRELNFDIEVAAPYKPQDTATSPDEETSSSPPGSPEDTKVIEDVKDKVEQKKEIEDNIYKKRSDNNNYIDDGNEPTLIEGSDEKNDQEIKERSDGITGAFTIGGMKGSTLIILAIIVIAALALFVYLRS